MFRPCGPECDAKEMPPAGNRNRRRRVWQMEMRIPCPRGRVSYPTFFPPTLRSRPNELGLRIFAVDSQPSLNMEPVAFVAASAEEAVAQIRARLGPEAVVLNVRPLPAHGLARLWQKPMIEVLAYRPETAAAGQPLPFPRPWPNSGSAWTKSNNTSNRPPEKRRPARPPCRNSPPPFPHWTPAAGASAGCCKRPACCRFMPSACWTRCARSTEISRPARWRRKSGWRAPSWRQRLAAVPALPGALPACRDRAGGIGQNDLPLQMAHPGGVGGRAAGAGLAPGRRHRQHGGIPDRLL